MVLQANLKSISDIKEQALKLDFCIVSYKTFNYGWTARVCKIIDEEKTFHIDRFIYMPFAKSELAVVAKAYIHILEGYVNAAEKEK